MPNKIQLKRSDVAARRPTTADLADGELFLNINDDMLSIKNKAGTYVRDIIPKVSTNSAYLDAHVLGLSGAAAGPGVGPENANTSVAHCAPIRHRHPDVVGVTNRITVSGQSGKTLYYGNCLPQMSFRNCFLSNITVAIDSYWVNSGDVTLSIGTYNYATSTIIDEEAYLKKISIKSDSPIAYGETISLRNPKTFAGSYISNGSFLGSFRPSNSEYVPYFFIRCPSGGTTSGILSIFAEFPASCFSGSYTPL